MATAEELLNSAADSGVVVTDTKSYFTVDLNSRIITPPFDVKNIGVESDDEVTRLYFKVPRFYDDIDLSEFTIRINYTNANGEDDMYGVDDVVVGEDEFTFSWLVGRFAVTKQGTVSFIVCMIQTDDFGVIDREFNTTTCSLLVLKGLEAEPFEPKEEEKDIVQTIAKEAAKEALEEVDIPTKVSELKNDKNYISDNDVSRSLSQIAWNYDTIITSQEEFDTMIQSPTWNDAVNVYLDCNINLGVSDENNPYNVHVPENVKFINANGNIISGDYVGLAGHGSLTNAVIDLLRCEIKGFFRVSNCRFMSSSWDKWVSNVTNVINCTYDDASGDTKVKILYCNLLWITKDQENRFELDSHYPYGVLRVTDTIPANIDKNYVDGLVGDIETALDSIIAMQNSLIGGETV